MPGYYHAKVEKVAPISSTYGGDRPWHVAEITFSREIRGIKMELKQIIGGAKLQQFSMAVQGHEIEHFQELYSCRGLGCVIYIEEKADITVYSKDDFQE